MRPPPSVTQQPVVVTRQPVQRSQPGIASSVQARSPPIPTPEDRHRATAELKEHYHEKLGVVDEHVALLCAIAEARNLTPQNSIIVYAYLRRLNAAGKRSDGSNVFELPFSLELVSRFSLRRKTNGLLILLDSSISEYYSRKHWDKSRRASRRTGWNGGEWNFLLLIPDLNRGSILRSHSRNPYSLSPRVLRHTLSFYSLYSMLT